MEDNRSNLQRYNNLPFCCPIEHGPEDVDVMMVGKQVSSEENQHPRMEMEMKMKG